ncbi:MAG: T9SS type A sorting domain-containing protein [FCB group bacterium]|jgi:photosystem II stability/assembly factor-like uncharacterized protein
MKKIVILIFILVTGIIPLKADWEQTKSPYGSYIISLAVIDSTIFAGANTGTIFRSTNKGQNWEDVNHTADYGYVWSFAVSDSIIYADELGTIVYSSDKGKSWQNININNQTGWDFQFMTVFGKNLIVGNDPQGLFYLEKISNGYWSCNNVLTKYCLNCSTVCDSVLFVGHCYGILKSTDFGNDWNDFNDGLNELDIRYMFIYGNYIFAASYTGNPNYTGYLYRSSINDTSWIKVANVFKDNITCTVNIDSTLFAGTGNGVYKSLDSGLNWTPVNTGLTNFIKTLAIIDSTIFAGTDAGVFISTNKGENWIMINNGMISKNISAIAIKDTNIFFGSYDGIYQSTNNGMSWDKSDNGSPNTSVNTFYVNDTLIIAGTNEGNYLSTDNGKNWLERNGGLDEYNRLMWCYAGLDNYLFAGGSTVYKSNINYLSWWDEARDGLNASWFNGLAVKGNEIFAGAINDGVFRSTNLGNSWTKINKGLTDTADIRCLIVCDTNLFVGTYAGGISRYNESDSSWSAVNNGLPQIHIFSLAVWRNYIFACGQGIYMSSNYGSNWVDIEDNLQCNAIFSIGIKKDYIFAGTNAHGVWRRPLSEVIPTEVKGKVETQNQLSLITIFPNPTNNELKISYNLNANKNVIIIIIDVLGNNVYSAVEQGLAGANNSSIDLSAFPQGVYYLKLSAGADAMTNIISVIR